MQEVMALSMVALAAAFLTRSAWLRFRGRSGGKCGSCASCGGSETIKERPLVTINMGLIRAETPRRGD
jgi:hypothetical protein